MHALALRYAKDDMEAEDIVMIGFRKIFARLATYSGAGSFEGWMKRIIINSALTIVDQHKRQVVTAPIEEATLKFKHQIDSAPDVDHLISALKTLPGTLKTPFELYAIEGLTHKEISDTLGISESVSKTRVCRARKNIRATLRVRERVIQL